MKIAKRLSILCSLVLALGATIVPDRGEAKKPQRPLIQMAILLDTSSSMQGLIEQAKSQLWKVVNEFIASKKAGQRPEIQVALYEYGKSSIPAGEGHIRMGLGGNQHQPHASDQEAFADDRRHSSRRRHRLSQRWGSTRWKPVTSDSRIRIRNSKPKLSN